MLTVLTLSSKFKFMVSYGDIQMSGTPHVFDDKTCACDEFACMIHV